MVKFAPAFFVLVSLALAVLASPIEQRDVNKVKSDLRQVASDVSNLDTLLSGVGTTITIMQALNIKSSVETIESRIDQSTKDVKEVNHVSEADARDIMNEVNKFVPTIVHTLQVIDGKQDAFHTIPITGAVGVIQQVLQDLHSRSAGLADALINVAPADIKAEATRAKDAVETAFKKVIHDFSA